MHTKANLISKVFHRSVAATNTPDVVQMSHTMIHRQQYFSFLQSRPISYSTVTSFSANNKLKISMSNAPHFQHQQHQW